MNLRDLVIYTDGSGKHKPRRGGIGVRIEFPSDLQKDDPIKEFQLFGYKGANNIEMELRACIEGLKIAYKLPEIRDGSINCITVLTDLEFIVNFYKTAIYSWSVNGWTKEGGGPVAHALVWKELVKQMRKLKEIGVSVGIEKVKGHSGNEGNEAVDKLARKSADLPRYLSKTKSVIRRKKTKELTSSDAIPAKGQRIKLRIVGCDYYPIQKMFRLRCEVSSKTNSLFGKIGFLYSVVDLRPGHEFLVKLNNSEKFPQIERVIKKIT